MWKNARVVGSVARSVREKNFFKKCCSKKLTGLLDNVVHGERMFPSLRFASRFFAATND